MDWDDHVCLCFRVTRRKLVNFARRTRPAVASRLAECGGAGTGCGWCVPVLEHIHRREVRAADPGPDPTAGLSAADYAARRAAHRRTRDPGERPA